IAAQVLRSHQLWECLLFDVLQLPWAAVHGYACRLEHATDEAVTAALDVFLGFPQRCPHGNPIPNCRQSDEVAPLLPLADLAVGQRGRVAAIFPESDELLAHVDDLGLRPGTEVTLLEIAPFGGPLMVQKGAEVVALGEGAARHITVLPLEGADS